MNEDHLLDLLRHCLAFIDANKEKLDPSVRVEAAALRLDITVALGDRWIPAPWGRPP